MMINRMIVLAFIASVAVGVASAQSGEDDRAAYNQATVTGTVEAWQSFLERFPGSRYVEQARKLRDNAIVKRYCNNYITLNDLTAYIDTTRAYEPRIKLFYANLVNNPTHSYRIEHLDVGFNGCTGRVKETVTMADGSKRDNVFVFNPQGLLTQSIIQGSKGNKTVVDYTYSYNNLQGYSLKHSKSKSRTINYVPMFDNDDRRISIKGDNGSRQDYSYDESGRLNRVIITQEQGKKRTLLYKDGYIIREEMDGKAFRYHYDLDQATGKKFLIAIKELNGNEVVHERTFDYDIDTHGRYTRVVISLDGKPQMTITRDYAP